MALKDVSSRKLCDRSLFLLHSFDPLSYNISSPVETIFIILHELRLLHVRYRLNSFTVLQISQEIAAGPWTLVVHAHV